MGLEKQLRQYAEWRTLLAANNLTPTNEEQVGSVEINNVSRWSFENRSLEKIYGSMWK